MMKETIKNLKSLIRRYKTFVENGYSNYRLNDNELETIRQATRYLELVEIAVSDYNKGDDNDKNS